MDYGIADCDEDYVAHRSFLAEGCRSAGVEVWGYCLMPNHVHLILNPSDPDGLRAALRNFGDSALN